MPRPSTEQLDSTLQLPPREANPNRGPDYSRRTMIADIQPTARGVHELEFAQTGVSVSSVSTNLSEGKVRKILPIIL